MMLGKVTFVAVLMILFAMVFASLKAPRVADFVTNGSENSSDLLRSKPARRIASLERRSSLGDSGGADSGEAMPMAPQPARAPIAAAPPQVAPPADSSDPQMNDDNNSNDNDSNDNDNNDSSDDRNSNDDNESSSDQAMNNQGSDEQSNNPFMQPVPAGMFRTPNGQLMPQVTPPAIAPFPPQITNN